MRSTWAKLSQNPAGLSTKCVWCRPVQGTRSHWVSELQGLVLMGAQPLGMASRWEHFSFQFLSDEIRSETAGI